MKLTLSEILKRGGEIVLRRDKGRNGIQFGLTLLAVTKGEAGWCATDVLFGPVCTPATKDWEAGFLPMIESDARDLAQDLQDAGIRPWRKDHKNET